MVRVSNSFLEELKDRVAITDVIKSHVGLKSKGRGEFMGLCPFHKEKTPSFTVSSEKQFYHCFGCGAHGDIFKFISNIEGVHFIEAVERVANLVGIPMPEMSEQDIAKEKKKMSLYEVMEKACQFFQKQLESTDGISAIKYLQNRGISQRTKEIFRLGYAPEKRNALKIALQAIGVTDEEMLEVGLVIKNDRGEIYDRFRGRIIFPITNPKGHVIAFGGRILGDGQPKYLNSPETTIFHKGSVLYNENLSRNRAYKTNRLVIAEGYMDVIAMHQAGIPVAVAPLGTALTDQQLKRVWSIVKNPVICLDGDNAGRRAMERAAKMALKILEPGYGLNFSILPEGKDPDDIIQNNGVNDLKSHLKNAIPLSDAIWKMCTDKFPKTTPESKAALGEEINSNVKTISNESVRNIFSQHFQQKLWQLGREINKTREYNNKYAKEPIRYTNLSIATTVETNSSEGLSIALLLAVVNNPVLLTKDEVKDILVELYFSEAFLDKIRMAILEIASYVEYSTKSEIVTALKDQGLNKEVNTLLSLKVAFLSEPATVKEKAFQAWDYILLLYRKSILKKECSILEQQFSLEAEEKSRILRDDMQSLDKEIKEIEYLFGEERFA